jgi:hypothetical protein
MEKAKRTEPVKINKLIVVLLMLGANLVAFTPVVMITKHPIVLGVILAVVLVLSILSVRNYRSRATEAPSLAEFILAGFEAICIPAFVATLWMASYSVLFGLVKVVASLAHLLGWVLLLDAASIAYYPSLLFGVFLFVRMNVSRTRDVCVKLYPDTAGIRSQYYKFFTTEHSRLVGAIIGALLIIVGLTGLWVTTNWNRNVIIYCMQLGFLTLGGVFLSETSAVSTEKKKRLSVVERVGKLLELAGYQVEISPRTQDAAIDPLLTNIDIFARREEHNLLLDIKSRLDAEKELDWRSTSTLIQSAYLLGSQRDIKPEQMDARLLLIDVNPDKSLLAISKQEKVPVLIIHETQIDAILEQHDLDGQLQAIRELLNLRAESSSSTRTQTV